MAQTGSEAQTVNRETAPFFPRSPKPTDTVPMHIPLEHVSRQSAGRVLYELAEAGVSHAYPALQYYEALNPNAMLKKYPYRHQYWDKRYPRINRVIWNTDAYLADRLQRMSQVAPANQDALTHTAELHRMAQARVRIGQETNNQVYQRAVETAAHYLPTDIKDAREQIARLNSTIQSYYDYLMQGTSPEARQFRKINAYIITVSKRLDQYKKRNRKHPFSSEDLKKQRSDQQRKHALLQQAYTIDPSLGSCIQQKDDLMHHLEELLYLGHLLNLPANQYDSAQHGGQVFLQGQRIDLQQPESNTSPLHTALIDEAITIPPIPTFPFKVDFLPGHQLEDVQRNGLTTYLTQKLEQENGTYTEERRYYTIPSTQPGEQEILLRQMDIRKMLLRQALQNLQGNRSFDPALQAVVHAYIAEDRERFLRAYQANWDSLKDTTDTQVRRRLEQRLETLKKQLVALHDFATTFQINDADAMSSTNRFDELYRIYAQDVAPVPDSLPHKRKAKTPRAVRHKHIANLLARSKKAFGI